MSKKLCALGVLMICLFFATGQISGEQENSEVQKPSWIPNQRVIFLDETEVLGQRSRPASRFGADHLARGIRPFHIRKEVRFELEYYEPRSRMQSDHVDLYDDRPIRQNW
ncbi:MAG: hypothetical protein B6244_07765 [Candidatus Cloacimonetes bacterium 4572_55]|nr:MAG: hypothetical protein B6244_07765 [Candidatus Cloacimonetes bacterium 4572_55]